MNNFSHYLEQFKKLLISKKELEDKSKEFKNIPLKNLPACIIYSQDVVELLNAFKQKQINQQQLLDWVNIVWFSDWFTFDQSECDCIVGIIERLEELDERKQELTDEEIARYIKALQHNIDIAQDHY